MQRLIAGVELFSTLLDDDLSYLASRAGFRSVSHDAAIFRSGERASQFFIVKTGEVAIEKTTRQGGLSGETERLEIARYLAGDVFGDFHFVISGVYNATARAVGQTELLVFPGDGLSFDRLCDEKPDTASRILLKSISMIESRLRSTRSLIAENAPWIRELKKQVFVDPATSLLNRAFLEGEIPHQLSGTVAALMIKPDRFKDVNDAIGHVAGDEILRRVASLLLAEAEKHGKGWAVRLRSNEMCLIIPQSTRAEAVSSARTIIEGIASITPEGDVTLPFTLSASVAIGLWPEDEQHWQRFLERTNEAMQDAWKTGGDRVVSPGREAR
jgi:diguanylate cyclase (GGDEF)-like protein